MSTTDNSLSRLITHVSLVERAGPTWFERGLAYFEAGRVASLAVEGDAVSARVEGTETYAVRLWAEDGELASDCSCPLGIDLRFCKHCVAVGLAWLAQRGERASDGAVKPVSRPGGAAKKANPLEEVRAYLAGLDAARLVEILAEQAGEDERLLRRLVLRMERERRSGPDLARFRREIDRAVRVRDFIAYRDVPGYAVGIAEVVKEISALIEGGQAAGAMELVEHALRGLEDVLGMADDSDGILGGLLGELQELHLLACERARPAPVLLARRLFEWEMGSEYEVFYRAADRYAEVLGTEGLVEYRALAAAEWEKLPRLGPGATDPERYGRRFRITSMMEALAGLEGDLDALVEVMSRDLSHSYAFLRIAEACREAGERDRAVEWAKRGLAAFPGSPDGRLRVFLAEEYSRRGRHAEAMELVWDEFAGRPDLRTYQLLKTHAEPADAWVEWRERALERIRAGLEGRKKEEAKPSYYGFRSDHSELVRIFLWEAEVESAWREAVAGGCSEELWRQLARQRETDHPEEVVPVYRRLVEVTITRTGDRAYREAVELLRRVRNLMLRLGQDVEFGSYLGSVRVQHGRKRNFIKLLDAAKWT